MDDNLTQAVKKRAATSPPDPDPIIIAFRRLGIRDHLIAKALSVTPGRVSQWNNEGQIPKRKRRQALTELRRAYRCARTEAKNLAENCPAVTRDPGYLRYMDSLEFVAALLAEQK